MHGSVQVSHCQPYLSCCGSGVPPVSFKLGNRHGGVHLQLRLLLPSCR